MARLTVEHLVVRFGGCQALDDASIVAEAGHVTGLIGPNGAGKTTLFNVISGLVTPKSGRVVVDGRDITHLSPTKRGRAGVARTFQRLELFGMLSVRENLLVAAETQQRWARAGDDVAARVEGLLERLGLADVAGELATSLPTGLCRRVEVGRALAAKPRVLLLDEPAAGQDDAETRSFATLLRQVAADDVAVVLVEHDVRLVMGSCDVVNVLDGGRVLACGTPDEVQHDDAVLSAYLGAGRPA
ncbi:MAG: ABC transporter ATP-binding protein [Actinobacteria bacterium]|nr:ABC transporter ATP-binding protein [Actinomycetota bacterium]